MEGCGRFDNGEKQTPETECTPVRRRRREKPKSKSEIGIWRVLSENFA